MHFSKFWYILLQFLKSNSQVTQSSHFISQFMDYLVAIRELGDRIYAFHAKDTQILRDRLNRVGVYGDSWLGQGWWRFRMPGYGDAD